MSACSASVPGSFFRNDGKGVYVEVSDKIGAENYWLSGKQTVRTYGLDVNVLHYLSESD